MADNTIGLLKPEVIQDIPSEPSVHALDQVPEVAVCPDAVANENPPSQSPKLSRRKKSLITPEMTARIKAKEEREEKRRQTILKNKELKEQAKLASVAGTMTPDLPAPTAIVVQAPNAFIEHQWKPGQSGNPSGSKKTKHTREAILKIISEAAEIDKKDPLVTTRWQKLIRLMYDRACDSDIKISDLMLIMNFLRDSQGEKPMSDTDEDTGRKPSLIVNIDNTRFANPVVKAEVIDVG